MFTAGFRVSSHTTSALGLCQRVGGLDADPFPAFPAWLGAVAQNLLLSYTGRGHTCSRRHVPAQSAICCLYLAGFSLSQHNIGAINAPCASYTCYPFPPICQTWGAEAFARRTRTKIHNFGAPLPPWENKEQRPTPAARGIPKSINIILLGPTGERFVADSATQRSALQEQ